ncbi:hypothetical protein ACHAWF_004105 [Thalassiosira exigua]
MDKRPSPTHCHFRRDTEQRGPSKPPGNGERPPLPRCRERAAPPSLASVVMTRPVAFVALSLIFAADGAMNLKIFSDPKDVFTKKKSSCATSASACEPPDIDLLEEQGFLQSEYGEDRCLIQHYFPGVCQGKFVEVGASDGIQSSNTYAFHQVLGWTGVNVEINPESYEKLQRNRRKDIANVHAAVCSDSHTVHYAVGEDKSSGGIWEFASEAHREQWWPNVTVYHSVPVKCTPLQSIFDQTVGRGKYFFDLAVIDLEGAELSALLGVDFDRISFGIIIIERSDRWETNKQVEDLLHSKGYMASYVEEECGGTRNAWYIRNDFHSIYQKLNVPRSHIRKK